MALYELYDLKESFVGLCYNPSFDCLVNKYLENLPHMLTKYENFITGKQWIAGEMVS